MKSVLNETVERLWRDRQRARRYALVFVLLAAVTTLAVNWSLHKNGISMTADYICGEQEHTHTEDCYTRVLVCEQTESEGTAGHTHTEECYREQTALVCAEGEHAHDYGCFDESGNALCGSEEHSHGEECYDEAGSLICGLAEHSHDYGCFDESGNAVCGNTEHSHTDACYETQRVLVCGQEESESADGHTHTEDCYEAQLTCGLAEHSHTAACLGGDASADVETAADWEATLPEELTGVWAEDVVAVAKSQLGYTESTKNYILGEDGTSLRGYTRYGEWYGNRYGDWCAMFAAFCLHYAEVPTEAVPVNSGCAAWIAQLKDEDVDLYRESGDYTPEAGDLVFFDWDGDGSADHVGIVTGLVYEEQDSESGSADAEAVLTGIETVEGNSGDAVRENRYEIDDETILGYGELPERQTLTQTAETENYRVTVTYGAEAGIPENAVLQVTEYAPDSEEYRAAAEQTGDTYDWLLDIAFMAEGEEIEPKAEIRIAVEALGEERAAAEDESKTRTITHFAGDGVESVTGEVSENTTSFQLGSLSLVGQVNGVNGDGIMLTSDTTASGNEGQSIKIPTRPTYSKDSAVSGAKSGAETGSISSSLTDVSVSYDSDPATSDIEKDFTNSEEQNGKVITDKSVVYGDDDYNAIDTYEAGTFGVTLSALSQEYADESDVRTPVDVVFVIDTSRSMDTDSGDGSTRRAATVNAVNNAIQQIQNNHPDNRVGVVTFSSGAWQLLELGRYTAADGKYITEEKSGSQPYVTSSGTVNVQSGYRGAVYKPSYTVGMYCGTYTQAGIAMGYQLFYNVQNDTTYTATLSDGTSRTVTRRPIVVLLSDGEPTYCTQSYDRVLRISNGNKIWSTVYGNGTGGAYGNNNNDGRANDKGVIGYYTILSALSYKQQIAKIYYGDQYQKDGATDARFYTIGMGINATGTANSSGSSNSVSGDHYKRAVLNPTSTNIGYLNSATPGTGDDVLKNDQTAKQLYTLLNQSWNNNQQWNNSNSGSISLVADSNNDWTGDMGGKSYSTISNPQETYPSDKDYTYADASWFGKDLTSDKLKEYFFSILMWNQDYKKSLQNNSKVILTDTLGTGMEVKGSPVLQFGSGTYTMASKKTDGNVTTYTYAGSVDYTDAYPLNANTDVVERKNLTFDLSTITVTVTTAQDGTQKIKANIPAALVPVCYPEYYGQYYYEEDPIRITCKVGLSDAGVKLAAEKTDNGETAVFYTNAYEGVTTKADFTADEKNPYRFDQDGDVSKTENATKTKETSFTSEEEGKNITQNLGNNGKLTISPPSTQITVKKEWSDSGSHDAIGFKLIQTDSNGKRIDYETGTLSEENGWMTTIQGLPTVKRSEKLSYTYSVEETNRPTGYITHYESVTDEKGNTTWIITNTNEKDVRLQVVKKWQDGYGNPVEDTSTLPEVTGTLYQNESYTQTEEGVTLTVKAYYYTTTSLWGYKKDFTTTTIGTYTVEKGSDFAAAVHVNGYNSSSAMDISSVSVAPSGSATASCSGNTLTVNNIVGNVTVTVNFDNRAGATPTVQNAGYTQPGSDRVDKVNTIGSFTLSQKNGWTAYWTAAQLNEQEGHSYSYYVTEDAVPGYTATVSANKTNPLTPGENDKTITITNRANQKDIVLPVEKQWIDLGGNVNANAPKGAQVYAVLLNKGTNEPVKDDSGRALAVLLNEANSWKGSFTLAVSSDFTSDLTDSYAIGELVTLAEAGDADVITGVLADGTEICFKLSEVYRPQGENDKLWVEQVPFTVSFGTKDTENPGTGENATTLVVKNTSEGVTIPETGGAGWIPFTAAGAGLMALALLMYGFCERRRRERRVE